MPTEQAHRIEVLVRHNLVLLARDPGHLIAYLVMPMVLMSVQAPLYRAALRGMNGSAGSVQVVAGMLVMFSLLALSIVGNSMLTERSWHTWDRLRAAPAGAAELLIGKALTMFGVLLLQQCVLLWFGIGVLGLRPHHPVLLAGAVLAWCLALLGCGTALATAVASHGQLGAACDIGGLVVSCLGGALAPLATMPGWARAVAPASPGYWAMAALPGAVTDDTGPALWAIAVLLGLAVVTSIIACVRIGRGWTRSRFV